MCFFNISVLKSLWLSGIISRYLVTTFKIVPRGTEGAVSVEGTLAGILASIVLAFVSFLMGEVLHLFLTLYTSMHILNTYYFLLQFPRRAFERKEK